MRILSKHIDENTSVQVHSGACYFIGATVDSSCDHLKIYNVNASGDVAAANQVGYIKGSSSEYVMLPKPGIYCSNGLYVAIDHGQAQVYYSVA